MEKRKPLLIIGVIAVLIIGIVAVTSFGFWKVDFFQTDSNIANSSCFELSFEEQNEEIQLQEVYPLTDSEGKRLQPYTFTVTNTCSNLASYQVNLENILHEYKELPLEYVKVELDNNTPVILTNHKEVEKSLEEAKDAYKLTSGTLEGKESVTYELRIWIDEDTPASDETSEASFLSKVSVVASPTTEEDITNDIQIAVESTTIDYNKEKEDFSINAVSSKVNLISYLFSDNKLTKEELKQEMNWSLILPEDKTFTTINSYTEVGTNYIYIKDEYGNIEESEIEVSKIDREGPRVIEIMKGEEWGAKSTITAKVIDDKSGFVGYALVLGSNEPNLYETVENTKNEYTITKEVNENGTYTLWMKDNLGNISKEEIEIINIDTIAPVISEITNSSNGNWVNTSISLSWEITEQESGIEKVQISTDGTNFSDLSETEWNGKTFDNERNDTVYIRAIDKTGNISNIVSTPLKIDKSAPSKPVLESTFTDGSGAYTSGSWTNKSVNIKSTSSDTLSGGVKTYYSYNQIEWYEDWNGTNSAVVIGTWTGEYDRTIYFKAVDAVGNESEYATILLRIDKSAPTHGLEFAHQLGGANGWYKELVIKITANDSLSGPSLIKYCVDTKDCEPNINGSPTEAYAEFKNNASEQKVCFRMYDNAGNDSGLICDPATYKVDNEAPTSKISMSSNINGDNGWLKDLILKVSLSDSKSGIADSKYCFTTEGYCDPGNPQTTKVLNSNEYTVKFGSAKKPQQVCVRVSDLAGNISEVECSYKYAVDTINPTAKIKAEADDCNAVITVSAEGSKDDESGIDRIQYKLDNGQWYLGATTYNFTNVITGSHTVYVKIRDVAGREKESNATVFLTNNTLIDQLNQCVSTVTHGNGLYIVDHPDANLSDYARELELRYAGSNPNNYVKFNGETWRIIGLVNTEEGQRVKIIRNDSIGNYSWDSSISGINNGLGVNEWSQADLKTLLNSGAYYNRTSGTCYNGQNNRTTSCDFSSTGLNNDAKSMIDTVTWNLGSNLRHGIFSITPEQFYIYERGDKTGKRCTISNYCKDDVERTLFWAGKVGLMYPSDYGYATSNRTCLSEDMNKAPWDSTCYSEDWLYKDNVAQWTISPASIDEYATRVFGVFSGGKVQSYHAGANYLDLDGSSYLAAVVPSVHLLTSVKVKGGNGTVFNPYVLYLN